MPLFIVRLSPPSELSLIDVWASLAISQYSIRYSLLLCYVYFPHHLLCIQSGAQLRCTFYIYTYISQWLCTENIFWLTCESRRIVLPPLFASRRASFGRLVQWNNTVLQAFKGKRPVFCTWVWDLHSRLANCRRSPRTKELVCQILQSKDMLAKVYHFRWSLPLQRACWW